MWVSRFFRTGARRELIRFSASEMFRDKLDGHILALTHDGATGRPIDRFDCQIAAIARLHGAALATRDTESFRDVVRN